MTVSEILPGVFRWAAFSPHHKVELAAHAVCDDRTLLVFDPIPLADEAMSRLWQGLGARTSCRGSQSWVQSVTPEALPSLLAPTALTGGLESPPSRRCVIVLTNENHERDGERWRALFDATIWALGSAEGGMIERSVDGHVRENTPTKPTGRQEPGRSAVLVDVTVRAPMKFHRSGDVTGALAELPPEWKAFPLPGGAPGEMAFQHVSRSLMVFGDAVVNLPERGLELLPAKYCRDQAELRCSLRTLPPFERAVFAHGQPLLSAASERIAALL